MGKLSAYAKAAAALVLAVITNLLSNLVNGTTPWPQNGGEWTTLVVTSVVTGLGVYALPNTTHDPAIAAKQSVQLRAGRHELPE